MASTIQDELYRRFLAVAGQQTAALGNAGAMLTDVVAQIREIRNSAPVVTTAV